MSEDLIKRSDAIKAVSKVNDYDDGIGFEVRSHCLVELELVPSADRPKGEWRADYEAGFKTWECSECGIHMLSEWNFCPNCGADMRGEDNE